MFDLDGRTAVVTGAGRGLGLGIADRLAEAGADVVLVGRSAGDLSAAAERIASTRGVRAYPVVADLLDRADLAALADRVWRLATPTVWVNNAGGVPPGGSGAALDLDERQWDAVVDANLKTCFLASQLAARRMDGGSIVNVSSRSAGQAHPGAVAYAAAKAAVESVTATLAVEWRDRGVRVNAVAPGVVDAADPTLGAAPGAAVGTPADVGAACVFLASDEAAWISGATLHLHGAHPVGSGLAAYVHRP